MNRCIDWLSLTISQILSNIANLYQITVKNPTNNITYKINTHETCLTYYPILIRNLTANPRTYRYTINLPKPDGIPTYVFAIRADCEFDEFLLSSSGPGSITGDINAANGYFFRSHFTYDTTWNPPMLPVTPYSPSIYKSVTTSPNSQTQFIIRYVNDTEYYIDVVLAPYTYVVGTLNLGYSDIYPSNLQDLSTFKFSIQRTLLP